MNRETATNPRVQQHPSIQRLICHDPMPNKPVNGSAAFHVQDTKMTQLSNTAGQDQPLRRCSISTPHNMGSITQQIISRSESKEKKKKFNFRRLFRKGGHDSSQDSSEEASTTDSHVTEALQRKTELEFAHTLMTRPAEIGMDIGHPNSEPDLVQTLYAPDCFSKEAIRLDKKLYQIDVANGRIATLGNLSATAALASDETALNFLQDTRDRIRKQQITLFKEADKLISTFVANPKRLLLETNEKMTPTSPKSPSSGNQIVFMIDDQEADSQDLRWEMNSLHFSTDATSSESDTEGPPPEEIMHLAKEVRKAEGTRFKRKLRKPHRHRTEVETTGQAVPPPPNPIGHQKRALLRSHTSVPSGLCQQGHSHSSFTSTLGMSAQQQQQQLMHRGLKRNSSSTLPFNLLSLTGQLSWLVSEYLDRGSSTYQWATDLIHSISKMSVTRSAWLNVHQQLRETTELLYTHRNRNPKPSVAASAKGEIAWTNIQAAYQAIRMGDMNATTVTAETARQLLSSANSTGENKLTPLCALLEKKFHLAYVCDLILWRAHKVLFANQDASRMDPSIKQLTDFRIRLAQVRLDSANSQNWSPELMDWMLRWINDEIDNPTSTHSEEGDRYCLNELHNFKTSINKFKTLVQWISQSEFTSEEYFSRTRDDETGSVVSENSEVVSNSGHHSLHCHPHYYHHGQGGHQQDLRPMDADRCSHTYAALIQQIHDRAMSQRPLKYFAVRALYDIAMELNCTIDWNNRMDTLQSELRRSFEQWEQLFKVRFRPKYYEQITGTKPEQSGPVTSETRRS